MTIQAIRITVAGRPLARVRVGQPTRLVTRPGLLMSQSEVEAALRARLHELGGAVEWAREVQSVTQDEAGVTVGLADGEALRAGWVVGCDGAGSAVRKAAGIAFPGVAVIERFLLADVHADLGLPRDEVAVWLHGEEMLGAFPLPGGVWRLMAPAPADTPDALDDAAVAQVMGELLATRAGIAAGVVRSTSWTSTFRIHRRMVESYRRGRVLLAGDAAHIHSPFGGQGMNTGLGDAENLAFKLALVATGCAAPGLLDSYEAERRPVAADVLASTTALTRLVLGGIPLARAVRDHVFVPLLNRPRVQRLIWERSSQLMISYRGGPLSPRHVTGLAVMGHGPVTGSLICPVCAPVAWIGG